MNATVIAEPTLAARMVARRKIEFDPYKFTAFFHIAAVGVWKDVVAEIQLAFNSVGVHPRCCVLGTTDDLEWVKARGLDVIYHSTNVHEYETPTLQRLWDWCRQNPDGAVLYSHTKGASWPASDLHSAWRRLMVSAVVAPCTKLLPRLGIVDLLGVSWEDNPDYPHFCGNFWMARADWITELDSPISHRNGGGPTYFFYPWDRMSAEMWVGSKGWHHIDSLVCRNFPLWTDAILFDIEFPGSSATELRALRKQIEDYGSDSLSHFGGTFEGGGRIQQNPREFARFLLFLKHSGHAPFHNYLEIGSASGCSIRAIHDTVGIMRASAIDLGQHPGCVLFPENTKGIPHVELLTADSHSPEAKVFLEGKQFDLIGIDADHTYESVKRDWELARPHMKPGTLVWFHDTRWCDDVRTFVDELSRVHSMVFRTDIPGPDHHNLGIRVIQIGSPSDSALNASTVIECQPELSRPTLLTNPTSPNLGYKLPEHRSIESVGAALLSLTPWVTKFVIDGHDFGGSFHAATDERLRLFQELFPDQNKSVLELGSLEGGHTIEIARCSRSVTAIEGREENRRRAELISLFFGTNEIKNVTANLENFDLGSLGRFDVCFNVGLLYHLPEPWRLLHQVSRCAHAMFLWTHIADHAEIVKSGYEGVVYREFGYTDPLSGLSDESFWPTYEALLRMLVDCGFSNCITIERHKQHCLIKADSTSYTD